MASALSLNHEKAPVSVFLMNFPTIRCCRRNVLPHVLEQSFIPLHARAAMAEATAEAVAFVEAVIKPFNLKLPAEVLLHFGSCYGTDSESKSVLENCIMSYISTSDSQNIMSGQIEQVETADKQDPLTIY